MRYQKLLSFFALFVAISGSQPAYGIFGFGKTSTKGKVYSAKSLEKNVRKLKKIIEKDSKITLKDVDKYTAKLDKFNNSLKVSDEKKRYSRSAYGTIVEILKDIEEKLYTAGTLARENEWKKIFARAKDTRPDKLRKLLEKYKKKTVSDKKISVKEAKKYRTYYLRLFAMFLKSKNGNKYSGYDARTNSQLQRLFKLWDADLDRVEHNLKITPPKPLIEEFDSQALREAEDMYGGSSMMSRMRYRGRQTMSRVRSGARRVNQFGRSMADGMDRNVRRAGAYTQDRGRAAVRGVQAGMRTTGQYGRSMARGVTASAQRTRRRAGNMFGSIGWHRKSDSDYQAGYLPQPPLPTHTQPAFSSVSPLSRQKSWSASQSTRAPERTGRLSRYHSDYTRGGQHDVRSVSPPYPTATSYTSSRHQPLPALPRAPERFSVQPRSSHRSYGDLPYPSDRRQPIGAW